MEQTADEIRRLQGCINDLISVLALPAMWRGQESVQIVSTLLDVWLGMLRLDFAYARLKDPIGGAPIEMVRLAQSRNLTAQPQEIGQVLNPWLGDDPHTSPLLVRNPTGDGDVSIVPSRLGFQGKMGVLVAGSQRADYRTQGGGREAAARRKGAANDHRRHSPGYRRLGARWEHSLREPGGARLHRSHP